MAVRKSSDDQKKNAQEQEEKEKEKSDRRKACEKYFKKARAKFNEAVTKPLNDMLAVAWYYTGFDRFINDDDRYFDSVVDHGFEEAFKDAYFEDLHAVHKFWFNKPAFER